MAEESRKDDRRERDRGHRDRRDDRDRRDERDRPRDDRRDREDRGRDERKRHRDEERGDRHRDDRRNRGDRYRGDRRDRDRDRDRKRSLSPTKGYEVKEREAKKAKLESTTAAPALASVSDARNTAVTPIAPILTGPLLTQSLTNDTTGGSDVKKNNLKAVAEMLAMKRAQLEQQKSKLLEEKKKEKEKAQIPVVSPLALQSSGATGALLLDELGREIDREGNVIAAVPVPQKHASLLANKKRLTQTTNITILDQKAATNPYLLSLGSKTRANAPTRVKREFNWTEPGVYALRGEELREEVKNERFLQLEAKIRSEENKKNAALLESMIREEQAEEFRKEEREAVIGKVMTVEWWDKPFLLAYSTINKEESLLEANPDYPVGYGPEDQEMAIDVSTIDNTIIHPVPIPPPLEKEVEAKPLPLTKAERKRIKKQKKAAQRKDERDQILLGLVEAPKHASMDPTKIETIVVEECAERKQRHEVRNQERKLTPHEKKEKRKNKLLADRVNELTVCVFKILHLSRKNRFKVDKNAQQLYLTGCCVITPSFTLVVVEGGPKSLRRYKKLMMRRIKWDQEEERDEEVKSETEEMKEEDVKEEEGKEEKIKEIEFDVANNRCDMIWEGKVQHKSFNDFQIKTLRTEGAIKRFLATKNSYHYYETARHFIPGK